MCAGGSDARVGFDWMTRWGTLIGWRHARPLLAWPWAASYEVNFLVNLHANKTQFSQNLIEIETFQYWNIYLYNVVFSYI